MSSTVPDTESSSRRPAPVDLRDRQVALMSHHTTFALQMRHAGLDVHESRDVEELAALARAADVVVVDLVALEGKRGMVARLNTAIDPAVPVVLISADEVDLALLGPSRPVHVVVPPVRADDVVACVRQVLSARPARRRPHHLEELPPPIAIGSSASLPIAAASPPETAYDETVVPLVPLSRGQSRAERRATRAAQRKASTGPVPTPNSPAREATGGVRPVPEPTRSPAPASAPDSAPARPWQHVAAELIASINAIPPVPAAAQSLANDVARSCGCDVAIMVPDPNGVWQVEAGVGLRSFEWGQTVEDTDWLVVTGRDKYPSLLVADTDTVRGDLVGAPLASRHQLLRTHATRMPMMVVAGWTELGDDKQRVEAVVGALRRHEFAVAEALELRHWVRVLNGRAHGVDAIIR